MQSVTMIGAWRDSTMQVSNRTAHESIRPKIELAAMQVSRRRTQQDLRSDYH